MKSNKQKSADAQGAALYDRLSRKMPVTLYEITAIAKEVGTIIANNPHMDLHGIVPGASVDEMAVNLVTSRPDLIGDTVIRRAGNVSLKLSELRTIEY